MFYKSKILIMSSLLSAILLFPLSSAHAEEMARDGYWWTSMGHIAKGYFVEGFDMGIKEVSENQGYFQLRKEEHLKIIDGLDLFYKDIANREIHFQAAIYIVLQKIHGKPLETINTLTKLARQAPDSIPLIP